LYICTTLQYLKFSLITFHTINHSTSFSIS